MEVGSRKISAMNFTRKITSLFVFLVCVMISIRHQNAEIGCFSIDSPSLLQIPPSHRKLQVSDGPENSLPAIKSRPLAVAEHSIRSTVQELDEYRTEMSPALRLMYCDHCFVENAGINRKSYIRNSTDSPLTLQIPPSDRKLQIYGTPDGVFLGQLRYNSIIRWKMEELFNFLQADNARALMRLMFHYRSVKRCDECKHCKDGSSSDESTKSIDSTDYKVQPEPAPSRTSDHEYGREPSDSDESFNSETCTGDDDGDDDDDWLPRRGTKRANESDQDEEQEEEEEEETDEDALNKEKKIKEGTVKSRILEKIEGPPSKKRRGGGGGPAGGSWAVSV